MQGVTSAMCNNAAAGTTVNLTDTRDGKVYRVRKMADGRCWMIDNLAFSLANTNAPAYNPTEQLVSGSEYSVSKRAQYALNSSFTTNAGQATYLYNWCAAMGDTSINCATTAGYTGPKDDSSVELIDICPAPFRLPIASNVSNEFAKLDIAMGGTGKNIPNANAYSNWMGTSASSMAWGGVYSGAYESRYIIVGNFGYWWSSTAYSDSTYANTLHLYGSDSGVNFDKNQYKSSGFAVRCIL
jgi:uncharacterized protein (TIGR02145 family)